jgi:DNA repair exonuclease SbcCD ATPase subunit
MDEPVLIEFTTQKVLKGGGTREGLFVNVSDAAGCRDIKRHSCGEQGFLRKVVRQAMALYNAERRGRHHRIFCCDEPTLGLDDRNVPRLLSIIYRMAARFRQIWIVSHDSVLLQGIPVHFRLDKVNGATVLCDAARPAAAEQKVA